MTELSGANINNANTPTQSSGRKLLLILAVIFVLPFTIAATLHLLNVHPSSNSYGELIKPPHALRFPVLHEVSGKVFTPQQWLKKWSIVTIDVTGCAERCQAQVHLLKQVNTALDKDAHRLQRVLVLPSAFKADAFSALQKQYPDLVILAGDDVETVKFSGEFNAPSGSAYLVDPLGNLMMHYPQNMNPKGMLSDLKRLLKNSWAG